MGQAEQIKEITEKLEEGIQNLFQSDTYKNYLKTLSKFTSYSFNNTLLIAMQKPDATLVGGYTVWQQAKRQVIKGEKAIKILAPCPYKKKIDKPLVDENGKQIMGADGKPITEKTEQVQMSFKIANVFDIEQTIGEPIEIAHKLDFSVDGYDDFMEALKRFSPVPVIIKPVPGAPNGYYDLQNKEIVIDENMSQAMHVKTGIHELSHSLLHDRENGLEKDNLPDSRTKEVQAESISFTVLNYFGCPTDEYSFGYIAGWSSEKSVPELKQSMEIIRETSQKIINGISEKLDEIKLERDMQLSGSIEKSAEIAPKEKAHVLIKH